MIRLRWNEIRAEARRHLQAGGHGDELRQMERRKVIAAGRATVARAREEAALKRAATQAGRRALIALWQALGAFDRARNFPPSLDERRQREMFELMLKRIAGLR